MSEMTTATTGASVETTTAATANATAQLHTTSATQPTQPATAPVGVSTAQPNATQQQNAPDDVSRFVARESRAAVEKLLRDAGITPDNQPEAQLKDYKVWLDGQKTALSDATAKAQSLERQVSVLSKGIPADKADRYVRLASSYLDEKTDFAAALDAALADFPITAQKTVGAPPVGGGVNGGRAKLEDEPLGAQIAKANKSRTAQAQKTLESYTIK